MDRENGNKISNYIKWFTTISAALLGILFLYAHGYQINKSIPESNDSIKEEAEAVAEKEEDNRRISAEVKCVFRNYEVVKKYEMVSFTFSSLSYFTSTLYLSPAGAV